MLDFIRRLFPLGKKKHANLIPEKKSNEEHVVICAGHEDLSNFNPDDIPWGDGPESVNAAIDPYLDDENICPKIVESFRSYEFADEKAAKKAKAIADQATKAFEIAVEERKEKPNEKANKKYDKTYKRYDEAMTKYSQAEANIKQREEILTNNPMFHPWATYYGNFGCENSIIDLFFAADEEGKPPRIQNMRTNIKDLHIDSYLETNIGLSEFFSAPNLSPEVIQCGKFIKKRIIATQLFANALLCKGENHYELDNNIPLYSWQLKAEKQIYAWWKNEPYFVRSICTDKDNFGVSSEILKQAIVDDKQAFGNYLKHDIWLYEFLSKSDLAYDLIKNGQSVMKRYIDKTDIIASALCSRGRNICDLDTKVQLNDYKLKAEREVWNRFCTDKIFAKSILKDDNVPADVKARAILYLEFNHKDVWKEVAEPYVIKSKSFFRRLVNNVFGNGLLFELGKLNKDTLEAFGPRSTEKANALEVKWDKEKITLLEKEKKALEAKKNALEAREKLRLHKKEVKSLMKGIRPTFPCMELREPGFPMDLPVIDYKDKRDPHVHVDLPVLD